MTEQDIKDLTAEYEAELRAFAQKHKTAKSDLYALEEGVANDFKSLKSNMLERAIRLSRTELKKNAQIAKGG